MVFKKEAKNLMRFFFDRFDIYSKKKNASEQKKTDDILCNLYEDIKVSDKYVDVLLSNNKVNTVSGNIKNLPESTLMSSNFVPNCIVETIKRARMYIQTTCKMFDKKIKIYIIPFDDKTNIDDYALYIKNILVIIRILLGYANKTNGSLTLYMYLTKDKKLMPSNPLTILGSNNCNTAVTTACDNNGEILIYREEECLKVLIHEIFHNFCLDMNGFDYGILRKNIAGLFKIKSDMEISETYSEFWATIINSLLSAYYMLDDPCDRDSFLLYSEFCLEFEKSFSIFQTIKILDFMGLSYNELVSNTEDNKSIKGVLYREKTNVFTYYILKVILLCNYDLFLDWCKENNTMLLKFRKTPQTLNSFYKFIENKHKDKELIGYLNKKKGVLNLYNSLKSGSNFPYKDKIRKTMRMTIIELKLN
jgi:hypothetical protein